MIKKIIIKLFFRNSDKQKILFGPSKGSFVNYSLNSRLQHLLGLYENEIHSYLEFGISNSDVLIDIGANDGYYVLAFLKSTKKVIVCEPNQISKKLIENCNLNGYKINEHYTLIQKFVTNENSEKTIRIHELTSDINKSVFYLIDIDGGEFELLNATRFDYSHSNKIFLIETHSLELERKCIRFLEERNYKVTIIKNAWWRLFIPEYRSIEHNRWIFAVNK